MADTNVLWGEVRVGFTLYIRPVTLYIKSVTLYVKSVTLYIESVRGSVMIKCRDIAGCYSVS
eukprot:jgi/Botrbrau1/2777/Bobra.0164s0054.1